MEGTRYGGDAGARSPVRPDESALWKVEKGRKNSPRGACCGSNGVEDCALLNNQSVKGSFLSVRESRLSSVSHTDSQAHELGIDGSS